MTELSFCFGDDHLKSHLHMERYRNVMMDNFLDNLIKDGTTKMSLNNKYRPSSNVPSYDLSSFSVPKDAIKYILDSPHPEVEKKFFSDDRVNFYVHPELVRDANMDYMDIVLAAKSSHHEGVSTSSFRTVAILNEKPEFCVKLHYPRQISSYYLKTLGPKTIFHSVQLSRDLRAIPDLKFGFLPESIGMAFPSENGKKGWGFLVREMTPFPISKKMYLVPFFALYNLDAKLSQSRLLLAHLIEHSGMNPKDFTLKLILMLMESWVEAVQKAGILFASHGQNALLEVDENLQIGRVIHRDLDTYVDLKRRAALGLTMENIHPQSHVEENDTDRPKGGFYSAVYDFVVGRLLNHLKKAYAKLYSDPGDYFEKACAKRFGEVMPEYKEHFTKDAYMFSTEFSGNNRHPIVKYSETPTWRPH